MEMIDFAGCRFELLVDGDMFRGLGRIWIGGTLVRSGRLPITVCSQTFTGLELAGLRLLGVDRGDSQLRIRLEERFRPLAVKLMRDHSFDPIHELGDWDDPQAVAATGELDLVIRPASDSFNGLDFAGFSYGWEHRSDAVPLFHIFEKASWELDGDIEGATAVSQSSCSDPVVTFARDTAWSTEGVIHWDPDCFNQCMTHNLPRWASHQAFDFQRKGAKVLLGVFDHVDLIRTTLRREPGKAELKTFDKHIFDQAKSYATSPKAILLRDGVSGETAMRNLWTWVIDAVHDRARAEFGLREVPTIPRLSQNYWQGFTIDTYYRDLLPAAVSLGFRELFIDNLNKSDMTECVGLPTGGNMCCGHEYEISQKLGGPAALKAFTAECRRHGIRPYSWTNNDQSRLSPIMADRRELGTGMSDDTAWTVRMEDTRIRYGGAYTDCFAILDFKREGPRRYWIDSLKRNKELSGLDGYLFDSFYNLGFMPVNYKGGKCTTQWRELLGAFKELQDAGIDFLIESFGPFGQPQHGCPRSYSLDNAWVVYKIGLGNDYTTVPSGKTYDDPRANDAAALYYALAHKVAVGFSLFKDGKRLDEIWGDAHRRALADYHAVRADMSLRTLREDGLSVFWKSADGAVTTVFSFADQRLALPGAVFDVTSGTAFPPAASYDLAAYHTYQAR